MEKSIKRGGEALGGEEKKAWREREVERILFYFISFFVYFSDLRKSDRRFSLGLKVKLIYAMRAPSGHQKVRVLTKSVR